MDRLPSQSILVFLPPAAAAEIAGRLIEVGYLSSVASSLPELHDALGSADFCLVVTTRQDIDVVRNIQPLPVINLEIFFHADPHGASAGTRTKQFDAEAFLGRVKALTEPGRAREKPVVAKTAAMAARPWGWFWRLLRFTRLREGRGFAARPLKPKTSP